MPYNQIDMVCTEKASYENLSSKKPPAYLSDHVGGKHQYICAFMKTLGGR